MSNMLLDDMFYNLLSELIDEWRKDGLSEEEIEKNISEVNAEEIINEYSKRSLDFFKDHIYEIALEEQADTNEFLAHQDKLWGKCFAASQTMYVMAVEIATLYSEHVQKDIDDSIWMPQKYTYLAIQHMHGRACQEFLEILHLMRLGFADCAYARWRSMYELCCCADFIIKFGENIAKQYMEQSETDDHKYSWTTGAIDINGNEIKAKTFKDIQKHCNVDPAWEKQYALSCLVNHASPQGTFKRLSNGSTQNVIPVGHSDYGIDVPAEHSAISLQWITSTFVSIFPYMEGIAMCNALHDWVEVIRNMYISVSSEAFGEKILDDK